MTPVHRRGPAAGHGRRLGLDRPAGPALTYAFDFGDGSAAVGPQAGATATHTYTSAGTFTVTVTVADTSGLISHATPRW